jgi:hypothetical protein
MSVGPIVLTAMGAQAVRRLKRVAEEIAIPFTSGVKLSAQVIVTPA